MSNSNSVKYDKYSSDAEPTANTPSPHGSLNHKNSLRGTKLARRARSFKDDFLEKISQIRTPTNTLGRSHSPSSPRSKTGRMTVEDVKPIHDLNYHVRQVKNALTHFKDVISKNKLEMLPGNGTVLLESIANVHTALQSYTLNEHSSALISATTQVYLSLGKLIKLCDEVLLRENEENCALLSNENVTEIVDLVDSAILNLVALANEKINERDNSIVSFTQSLPATSNSSCNTLQRPSIDVAGQRTSLPDIPLTPRERDILEQSSNKTIRTSHSTESILRESSPPPKPPLPNRNINPPPLPPKRNRNQQQQHKVDPNDTLPNDLIGLDATQHLSCGLDRMSLRSRSPDDNSSLLSVSSFDSALNHSKEEDELRALTLDHYFDGQNPTKEDLAQFLVTHKNVIAKGTDSVDSPCSTIGPLLQKQPPQSSLTQLPDGDVKNPRNSNESGFVSMHSLRSSMQSVSTKRSSEQSVQSSKSSVQGSEFPTIKSDSTISSAAISLFDHSSTSSFTAVTQQNQQKRAMTCFSGNNSMSMDSCCNNNHAATAATINLVRTSDVQLQMKSDTNVHEQPVIVDLNVTGSDEVGNEDEPPALPVKTRQRSTRRERHISQYDNVEETDNFSSSTVGMKSSCTSSNVHDMRQMYFGMHTKHQSLIEPRNLNHFDDISGETPPPLPVKKKHMFQSVAYSVMAYMEMFGNCSHSTQHNQTEFLRHSVHTYNVTHGSSTSSDCTTGNSLAIMPPSHQQNKNLTHSQTMSLSPLRKQIIVESITSTSPTLSDSPPALPPKKQRANSKTSSIVLQTPPSSPKLFQQQQLPTISSLSNQSSVSSSILSVGGGGSGVGDSYSSSSSHNKCSTSIVTDAEHHQNNTNNNNNSGEKQLQSMTHHTQCENNRNSNENNRIHRHSNVDEDEDDVEVVLRHSKKQDGDSLLANESTPKTLSSSSTATATQSTSSGQSGGSNPPTNLIEELNVAQYLVLKKEKEDGPDVKGGYLDALIVHASRVQKVTENAFGEAFITTFRTFITPLELMEKLMHRYTIFCCQVNDHKQKSAKESFSLLVRVVNDLTSPDLTSHHLSLLNEFVYQLVCSGQLMMAKLLRLQILEKVMLFKKQKIQPPNPILTSRAVITSPPTLLDLKSADIAEQMTLLDAELFQKIEIPEVLIWAQEQCEERSPNLTRFTEHFNKMSYWARSQILKQEDAKDREKHVIKFIKIMKHLRKINNYNSYLALLSALDSAPIRRLEWHKTITEGLKEYCALIDSSSSFRAYRQALAETNPPCIPYIGLVLQDLTFVYIGNQDYLSPNVINFSKRWQQHNIVVNMKRFKKCSSYSYKKNERIIGFFDNFENYLDEDAMWQISENIKPRISRKQQQQQQQQQHQQQQQQHLHQQQQITN